MSLIQMIDSLSLGGGNSLEINSCAFIIPLLIKCKARSWGRGEELGWSLNKKKEVGEPAQESMPRLRPHVGIISAVRGHLVTALAKLGKQSSDILVG